MTIALTPLRPVRHAYTSLWRAAVAELELIRLKAGGALGAMAAVESPASPSNTPADDRRRPWVPRRPSRRLVAPNENRLPQRCDGHRDRAVREDRGVRVMGELLGRGFSHFSGSWLVRLDPGS